MTSVLYDIPGPRARRNNRLLAVVGGLFVAALAAYVLYRFALTGQFSPRKWEILTYAEPQRVLLRAYGRTLAAAAVAAVLALVLGALLAAARLSDHRWLRGPGFAVVELFRAIPLVLLMFLFYYGTPALGFRFSPFWAVVLGLTLYNGSVLAEVFRAGVESVPRGQSEAAYAMGMRKTQVMTNVLLPQAIRAMLPAIISQLVVLLKDTALGFLVTYRELLTEIKQLATAQVFEFPLIPLAIVGGIIYVSTCLLLSRLATLAERRLNRSRKTSAPIGDGGTGVEGAARRGVGARPGAGSGPV